MAVDAFLLERREEVRDIASVVSVYIHKKTRAKVLHISNKDDNKLFSIAFNTPPKDNTGVFHIIEHSVLSGSRKYRGHDPFVEFYKSSLATFMNAMTGADITMYPFSTRNEKDFFNLMDMYLDSVFFPLVYEVPEIFYKEGWHYDINSIEDELKYSGVVYNEMRGLLSNRMSRLFYEASNLHYMGHCYKFNCGGSPQEICKLTYESFLESHKKYYHPSNCFVVLYGDMDIEKSLALLDGEYFSKFEAKNLFITTERQVSKGQKSSVDGNLLGNFLLQGVSISIKGGHREGEYPISENDVESKSIFSLGYKLDIDTDVVHSFVAAVLLDALFSSPSAPVRLKILEKNLAKDMYVRFLPRCRADFFIFFEDIEPENQEAILSTVKEELEKIIACGIDKTLLEGAISSLEFEWKEANTHNSHGLFYLFRACDYWYYGEDIFEVLNIGDIISKLRSYAKGRFFEDFIEQYLVKNAFISQCILKPSVGKNEADDKQLSEELKKLKSVLSKERVASLVGINEKLKKRVEEDVEGANIPTLALSDIKTDIWNCYYNVEKKDCVTFLHVENSCSDIVYFDFAFDISGIDIEKLPFLSFLTDLLTQVDTKNYSYAELNKRFAINTGSSSFFPEVIEHKDTHKIALRIVWNIKALNNKLNEMFALMSEVAHFSIFENEKRIKEVLESIILRMESGFLYRGDSVVGSRISSYLLEGSKYASLLGGFDYLKFLKDFNLHFEERIKEMMGELSHLYKFLFRRDNLVVSISSSKNNFDSLRQPLHSFVMDLEECPSEENMMIGNLCCLNEGITSSSDVLYVGKGYDIEKCGAEYSGKLLVLCNILNSGYLYNNIRAKGGAYGGNIGVYSNRVLIASSYRDPHLKETLKVYDDIYKFLEGFSASQEEMNSFVIGSLKEFYTPIFPESEAIRALRLFLSGRTNEDIKKTIEEALATSAKDIKNYAELAKKVFEKNCFCVFGNEKKIKDNKDLFESILHL